MRWVECNSKSKLCCFANVGLNTIAPPQAYYPFPSYFPGYPGGYAGNGAYGGGYSATPNYGGGAPSYQAPATYGGGAPSYTSMIPPRNANRMKHVSRRPGCTFTYGLPGFNDKYHEMTTSTWHGEKQKSPPRTGSDGGKQSRPYAPKRNQRQGTHTAQHKSKCFFFFFSEIFCLGCFLLCCVHP